MVRFENGQIEILDDGDISILAVRIEENKVYYIDFKELRKLITPDYIVFTPHISKNGNFFVVSYRESRE